MTSKLRIGFMVAVVIFVGALFAYNVTNKPPVTSAHVTSGEWNEAMTRGSAEAPNKMVEYADYFCSYCAAVQEAVDEPQFEKDYIETGKVRMETRIVTVLKEVSPNTEQGAEVAHCAADQGKFTEYSAHIVPRIKQDYFDKGIGVKTVTNPVPIEKLPLSYFTQSAEAVGMDKATFESCVSSGKHRQKVADDTEKAIRLGVTGLPYLVVNDYETSGFMGGYNGLKTILKAGGVQ